MRYLPQVIQRLQVCQVSHEYAEDETTFDPDEQWVDGHEEEQDEE